jgi:hypothetical protein
MRPFATPYIWARSVSRTDLGAESLGSETHRAQFEGGGPR